MRLSLIIYTTTILALSIAEFLNDPSTPSTIHRRLDNARSEEGRLPKRYSNDEANIKRLHIERHTGFDGKVRNIEIQPKEERPGIKAYGLPKKELDNNGLLEKIHLEEPQSTEVLTRNARVVEAYGMTKKRLENNGKIERMPPVAIAKTEELENDASRRVARSIPKELENEANDLEAQDAKVFRPLFVYRQQIAKRQKLNKRRDLAYSTPPYSYVYRPWVQRYPVY
ncbi:hypothetical protein KPH14_010177 [Odynerus spinipes]|uniref:Uncharacterized protein n=1 Tax=Odynerus spinipes TaxID=1348599 RepID=A0AAD9RTW9_9HYME|nr:hypothetical protein KPH14_010177 [Odynerus spinipes]